MKFYILILYILSVNCDPPESSDEWFPSSPFLLTHFKNYSTINSFVDIMKVLPESYRNVPNSIERVAKIMRFGTGRPNQKDFIDDLSEKLVNHYVFRYTQIRSSSVEVQKFFREVYELATDRSFLLLDMAVKISYLQEFARKKGYAMHSNDKLKFDELEMKAETNLYQTGLRNEINRLKH